MSKNTYAVVYGGQLIAGVGLEAAVRKFAQLYRIDLARSAELLSRRQLVLKHGLSEALARRYQTAFADTGIVTRIQLQNPTRSEAREAADNAQAERAEPLSTVIMQNAEVAAATPAASTPSRPTKLEATTIHAVVDFDTDIPYADEPVFDDTKAAAAKPARTRIMHVESAADFDVVEETQADPTPSSAPAPPATGPRPPQRPRDNLEHSLQRRAITLDDETAAALAQPVPPRVDGDTPPQPQVPAVRIPFVFHGRSGEYFRIWIINLALSVVTLGVYSAWAKVRNLRYFYGNTEVAGGRFEFHGTPQSILIGRVIALLVFGIYTLIGNLMPLLALPLLLVVAIVVPWMINRALAFRYRNTSFRGLRFGFSGNYFSALKAFVLWPIATALSAGLAFPYAVYAQKRYIVGNANYGRTRFDTKIRAGGFYLVSLAAAGILIGGAALTFALSQAIDQFALLLMFPAYLLAFAYFQAGTTNLVFNNSDLAGNEFDSSLQTGRLAMLHLTNGLALLLTLGLALPWARVRLARYRAERLALLAAGDLDAFIIAEQAQVDAVGEELGDVFDMDLGL